VSTATPAVPQGAEHPAPHRQNVSLATLWIGLMVAPGAWFLQLVIDTSLLSHACYPHDVPLMGTLPSLMPLVLGVDAAALLAALLAGIVAWRNWRHTVHEKSGGGHRVLASGDGRTRFMAMAGMLTCGLVGVAIVYTGVYHVLLRECGL
jgi:hypothetical protein